MPPIESLAARMLHTGRQEWGANLTLAAGRAYVAGRTEGEFWSLNEEENVHDV